MRGRWTGGRAGEPMGDLETALRAAVRELAGEGQPVDLGERALAGARRQARRRVAAAAVMTLAVLAGTWLLVGPHTGGETDADGNGRASDRSPPAGQQSHSPGQPAPVWPIFTGLGRAPAKPPGAPTDRMLVAAYLVEPGGPARLLDPVTGRYRDPGVDTVLAVSPDLRLALVTHVSSVPDETGSGPIDVSEHGIYDTVAGRMLGRLDIAAWANPLAARTVWHAAWSPDGATLVLSVRLSVAGRGWVADRLLFVDMATGVIRPVNIAASGGLEPVELLGWTAGGRAVALAAVRVGVDELPRGHVVYDLAGRPVGAYPWPGQRNAVPAVGADRLVLLPIDEGEITVVEVATGVVQARFSSQGVRAVFERETAVAWRGGELLVRSLTCTPGGGCQYGAELLALDPGTGQSRVLRTLPQAWPHLLVAPAPADLPAPVAAQAW